MVRLYELREKAIHDEVTRMNGEREEGESLKGIKIAKNLLKKGMSINDDAESQDYL